MAQDPRDEYSVELFRKNLYEMLRSAMGGRGKIAEMRASLDASILESAQLIARTDATLSRR